VTGDYETRQDVGLLADETALGINELFEFVKERLED
jgi:hypothetical protein